MAILFFTIAVKVLHFKRVSYLKNLRKIGLYFMRNAKVNQKAQIVFVYVTIANNVPWELHLAPVGASVRLSGRSYVRPFYP